VAHVELSLSDPLVSEDAPGPASSVEHWVAAVSCAIEPCIVIDSLSMIVAASPAACTLFGLEDQEAAVGRHLFTGVLRLIDFGNGAALPDIDREKIPPVLAYNSGKLSHGLLRVEAGDGTLTLDAIATPLFDGRKVVGSLTFFSRV
jgi:PAS domain-containing protein